MDNINESEVCVESKNHSKGVRRVDEGNGEVCVEDVDSKKDDEHDDDQDNEDETYDNKPDLQWCGS